MLLLALVVGGVIGALALADDDEPGSVAVSDIEAGDCLHSPDLAEGAAEVGDIEKVDCDEAHHAEVFAVLEFDEDQDEDLDGAGTRCVGAAEDEGRTLSDLETEDLEIRPLVASDAPEDGDPVVCFIRHQDGQELSDSEFE